MSSDETRARLDAIAARLANAAAGTIMEQAADMPDDVMTSDVRTYLAEAAALNEQLIGRGIVLALRVLASGNDEELVRLTTQLEDATSAVLEAKAEQRDQELRDFLDGDV